MEIAILGGLIYLAIGLGVQWWDQRAGSSWNRVFVALFWPSYLGFLGVGVVLLWLADMIGAACRASKSLKRH